MLASEATRWGFERRTRLVLVWLLLFAPAWSLRAEELLEDETFAEAEAEAPPMRSTIRPRGNWAGRSVQYMPPGMARGGPLSSNEPLGFSGALAEPSMIADPTAEMGVFDDPGYDRPEESLDPDGPAPTFSSGDWIKNGPWYTTQSAVYMDRSNSVRNAIIFSRDFSSSVLIHYQNQFGIPLDLGYQPGIRSTLGRSLGRDDLNRDHAIEFTFLGLTHWQGSSSITAVSPGGLFLDPQIDPSSTTPVFNGANTQSYYISSNFNSYELNYRIDRRLPRDQVVYTRDSTWVRQAHPTLLPTLYAGIRVATVNEQLRWTSQSSLGNGAYNVLTHNNMVGPQVGMDWFFERADWRIGMRGKIAGLVNWLNESDAVQILDNSGNQLVPNRNDQRSVHNMAFLGEANFIAEYHLRPNFALRGSVDLLWVTNQALAQNQVTFIPSNPFVVATSHSLFFQGLSFGFEYTR